MDVVGAGNFSLYLDELLCNIDHIRAIRESRIIQESVYTRA